MFDQLFKKRSAILRHQNAPLLEERRRYLKYLADQGAKRRALQGAAQYLLVIADYLRLSESSVRCIGHAEIDAKACRWSRRQSCSTTKNRCSRRRFVWHATQWLQFLGRLEQLPTPAEPYADEIKAFADYMLHERGLSPRTIASRCWIIRDFLSRLRTPVSKVTMRQIDKALQLKITEGGYARATVQTYAETLRAFFRYAERQRWCANGLAAAIKAPRVFGYESLPASPPWQLIQGLISDCDGDTPADIRNRALLMLLAVYGLRAGEVVSLKLEDLDWEREQLSIRRSKSEQLQIYPLCQSVGDAVLRYLLKARPRTSHRELFLTLYAPLIPLSRVGLTAVVTRKLKGTGVSLAHYGPHTLRHACATHMLQQGSTFKEIGDHLGHRHPDSTQIYAKVDLVGLRLVGDFDLGGVQ